MTSYTLQDVEAALVPAPPDGTHGVFGGLRLSSAFQPVFSLAHGRAVGHEALLRATDGAGKAVAPLDAFALAASSGRTVLLDRLSRAIHVRNFSAQAPDGSSWLFLNVSPQAIVEGRLYHAPFFADLLKSTGFPPHRVVVELLESSLDQRTELDSSVNFFRDLGCLIAIDDFGAGHSNFDRIWQFKPDIVKLDHSLVHQAYRDPVVRGMMPRICSMLHESGALVLMEGVETESQAMIAMDADVDFVQGYFFARPAPGLVTEPTGGASFDALFDIYRRLALLEQRDYQAEVSQYARAIDLAARQLRAGEPLDAAAARFLDLPMAERCYLLDRRGRQAAPSLLAARAQAGADPRFTPVNNISGSNWARRHYFRRAISHPDRVHLTRPYLSLATAALCVTVSISIRVGGELCVLCGDIVWSEKLSTGDRSLDTAMPTLPG
jgi:EAL domain-containing protein (putative c-di-GMP-specific phosphodiesterase class I)